MLFYLAWTQLFSKQTEKSLYLLKGFAEMGLKRLVGREGLFRVSEELAL